MDDSSNLRRYFISRFAGHLAYQIQSVAVGWHVYELTHSTFDLGMVGLVQFLPIFLFSIPGGNLADRVSRKNVSLFGIFIKFICAFLLIAQGILTDGANSVILMQVIIFFHASMQAFSGPANQSLLPDLVPMQAFPRAVALNSSLWQIAMTVGPLIGGLIYGAAGSAKACYGTSMALLLVALVTQAFLKVPPQKARDPKEKQSLFAGLKYVWERKPILGSISLDLFAVLLGGAVALLPAFAKDILHSGPTGLGILRSAPGIGAALTALVLANRPIKSHAGKKMFAAVILFGMATIGFGLSKSILLSFFCLLIAGAADGISVVVRGTLVQTLTPANMRGRVSAVNLVFISASNELGEFESGVTASLFGLVPSVVIGGIGTITIALLWSYFFPSLRKLDKLDGS